MTRTNKNNQTAIINLSYLEPNKVLMSCACFLHVASVVVDTRPHRYTG